jgi:hypothetical protein
MAPNVNKPTDIKQKEADVNRKLQIYGIISAFKAGKVPSVCATSLCYRPRSSCQN